MHPLLGHKWLLQVSFPPVTMRWLHERVHLNIPVKLFISFSKCYLLYQESPHKISCFGKYHLDPSRVTFTVILDLAKECNWWSNHRPWVFKMASRGKYGKCNKGMKDNLQIFKSESRPSQVHDKQQDTATRYGPSNWIHSCFFASKSSR
jgi:hypothetical protein